MINLPPLSAVSEGSMEPAENASFQDPQDTAVDEHEDFRTPSRRGSYSEDLWIYDCYLSQGHVTHQEETDPAPELAPDEDPFGDEIDRALWEHERRYPSEYHDSSSVHSSMFNNPTSFQTRSAHSAPFIPLHYDNEALDGPSSPPPSPRFATFSELIQEQENGWIVVDALGEASAQLSAMKSHFTDARLTDALLGVDQDVLAILVSGLEKLVRDCAEVAGGLKSLGEDVLAVLVDDETIVSPALEQGSSFIDMRGERNSALRTDVLRQHRGFTICQRDDALALQSSRSPSLAEASGVHQTVSSREEIINDVGDAAHAEEFTHFPAVLSPVALPMRTTSRRPSSLRLSDHTMSHASEESLPNSASSLFSDPARSSFTSYRSSVVQSPSLKNIPSEGSSGRYRFSSSPGNIKQLFRNFVRNRIADGRFGSRRSYVARKQNDYSSSRASASSPPPSPTNRISSVSTFHSPSPSPFSQPLPPSLTFETYSAKPGRSRKDLSSFSKVLLRRRA
ncbi:hypothetical protein A0H81_13553 [Grifola frondosa]|uniref:Uncharacterized protein n=1 Tax=Grifola frondosa TaxID=5627 RepID=A0A1C7LP21_GRIFR|nr:hypothetical protein A0H81_13553 [Grifola frondosa]